MIQVILRALICGFTLGTILFTIAPLGLGISLIESLKPILAPGLYLARGILGNRAGAGMIILALLLNGVIFTILFSGVFLIRKT